MPTTWFGMQMRHEQMINIASCDLERGAPERLLPAWMEGAASQLGRECSDRNRSSAGSGGPVPRRVAAQKSLWRLRRYRIVDNRSVAQTQASDACRITYRCTKKRTGGSRCALTRPDEQSERDVSLTEGRTCPRQYDHARRVDFLGDPWSCVPARAAVAANALPRLSFPALRHSWRQSYGASCATSRRSWASRRTADL